MADNVVQDITGKHIGELINAGVLILGLQSIGIGDCIEVAHGIISVGGGAAAIDRSGESVEVVGPEKPPFSSNCVPVDSIALNGQSTVLSPLVDGIAFSSYLFGIGYLFSGAA